MKSSKHYLVRQKAPSVEVERVSAGMARLDKEDGFAPRVRQTIFAAGWDMPKFELYMTPDEAEELARMLLDGAKRTREVIAQDEKHA